MFTYFKEMRELKRTERQLKVLLLSKLYDFVNGSSDVLEMANKLKDVDQKQVVEELVKYMKTNEKTGE